MKTAITVIVGSIFAAAIYILWKSNPQSIDTSLPSPSIPPQEIDVETFSRKVQELAKAIAFAEGFGVAGMVPTLFHNPGDLGPGDTGYPGESHSGSVVSKLPNDSVGWQFLYQKLSNIFTGNSSTYSVNMTFLQMGKKYAGDWQNWTANVVAYLQQTFSYQLTQDTTLAQWLEM